VSHETAVPANEGSRRVPPPLPCGKKNDIEESNSSVAECFAAAPRAFLAVEFQGSHVRVPPRPTGATSVTEDRTGAILKQQLFYQIPTL